MIVLGSFVFSGMCALQVNDSLGVALMPSEGGDHRPTLLIPTKNIQSSPELTTWKPDLLGDIEEAPGEFAQVGIWRLKGRAIQAVDAAATPIPWSDADKVIDFRTIHAGVRTRTLEEIKQRDPNMCVFRFNGGTLASAKTSLATVSREDTANEDRQIVARVKWTAHLSVIRNDANKQIAFSGDVRALVSNLAAVPPTLGETHVGPYYELLNLPAGIKRLTRVTDKDTTTFDCIRPVRID